MCGIAGIIDKKNKIDDRILPAMLETMSHRGPDGDGIFSHNNIQVGHRRLAIIDPKGGKQPLTNENGTVWITYNGEIYNFLDLRATLLAKGHSFSTQTDTEVIVHAYEEWGENCVTHLRGMFAFCIVDLQQEILFLARDHFGIKPLCYLTHPNTFAFASEITALKQSCRSLPSLNIEAIDMYLRFGYIPAPLSVFNTIHKLPPANWMKVSFEGEILHQKKYWQFEFRPDYSRSEDDWLEELDAILEDSVRQHLISDVPFGAFLSGGLDSSLVVSYMSRILHSPVQAFSIGFKEDLYDETHYAKIAAATTGADHHIQIVEQDALELLPKLVSHYGEPFADNSSLPTYYVSQLARKHVPMVLSGDGGDEIFAGYNSYTGWLTPQKTNLSRFNYHVLKRKMISSLFPDLFPPPPADGTLDKWLNTMALYRRHVRMQLWKEDYKDITTKTIPFIQKIYDSTENFPLLQKAQFFDIHTYLPFDILTKVDIASMANSLEVRTPLIDTKVIELASRIPPEYTMKQIGTSEWSSKYIIKKLLSRFFPDEFIHRPKMGFGVPVDIWFKQIDINQIVQSRLLSPEAKINEFFNQSYIRRMFKRGRSNRFWALLFLEEWLQQLNQ